MNENLVNKELKKYIEENIFKVYDLNKDKKGFWRKNVRIYN